MQPARVAYAAALEASNDEQWAKLLLELDFFKELGKGVQEKLTSICQDLSIPQGTVIFRQGDPPGNCYVLVEGSVGIFVKSDEELQMLDSRQGTPRDQNGVLLKGRRSLEITEVSSMRSERRVSTIEGLEFDGLPPVSPKKMDRVKTLPAALGLAKAAESAKRPSSPLKRHSQCQIDDGATVTAIKSTPDGLAIPAVGKVMSRRHSVMSIATHSSNNSKSPVSKELDSDSESGLADGVSEPLSVRSTDSALTDSDGVSDGEDDEDKIRNKRQAMAKSHSRRTLVRFSRYESHESDGDGEESEEDIPNVADFQLMTRRVSMPAVLTNTNRKFGVCLSEAVCNDEEPCVEIRRCETAEGFSLYHEKSFLGTMVATKGPGTLLGERALMKDEPRSATLKCLEDCEFLAISRNDFNTLLKTEMNNIQNAKVQFLKQHVPGMLRLPKPRRGRADVTYFFNKSSYAKGHTFLTQGAEGSDLICIVAKGAVEISRLQEREKSATLPFPDRPAAPMSPFRNPRSTPGTPSSSRPGSRPGSSGCQRPQQEQEVNRSRRVGTLVAGSVFGSLPTGGPEPFTVRVLTAPCECYVLTKHEMQRLPRYLLQQVKEYLVRSTTWRLREYKEVCARGQFSASDNISPKLTPAQIVAGVGLPQTSPPSERRRPGSTAGSPDSSPHFSLGSQGAIGFGGGGRSASNASSDKPVVLLGAMRRNKASSCASLLPVKTSKTALSHALGASARCGSAGASLRRSSC